MYGKSNMETNITLCKIDVMMTMTVSPSPSVVMRIKQVNACKMFSIVAGTK